MYIAWAVARTQHGAVRGLATRPIIRPRLVPPQAVDLTHILRFAGLGALRGGQQSYATAAIEVATSSLNQASASPKAASSAHSAAKDSGATVSPAKSAVSAEPGPSDIDATQVSNPAKSLDGRVLRIGVSARGATKLRDLAKAENNPDLVLKIHVESGGCHGFQYVFDLKSKSDLTKKHSVFERDGATVAIDHNSLQILRDSTVDYATELIGSQFKVVSPHTSSSCGCGSSFSIEPETSS